MEIAQAPVAIAIREILDAQKTDPLRREILSGQESRTGPFIETDDGLLRRLPPQEKASQQIVVPDVFRPRLRNLSRHTAVRSQPGPKKIYELLKKSFRGPEVETDIATTVRSCPYFVRNRLQLHKKTHPMHLFPTR